MKYMRLSKIKELTGDFGAGLLCLDEARQHCRSNSALKVFYDSSLMRLCERIDGTSVFENLNISPVYESSARPNMFNFEDEIASRGTPRPIVTLTTISSRIPRIERTIDSVLSQDLPAHSINLFISEEPYLVDEGVDLGDDHLKVLAEKGINIYNCANIGPYRKQYPLLSMLYSSGAHSETPIVTVDDDVIYPPDTLKRLVHGLYDTDSVTAFRGREITFSDNEIAPYKKFKAASEQVSLRNLGTGKNGMAYKLNFFPKSPSLYIGPLIAPTADDIWCKWVTAIYCVPTNILVPDSAFNPELDFEETDPDDKLGLFHEYNAKGSNDDAIRASELYFSKVQGGLLPILRDIA